MSRDNLRKLKLTHFFRSSKQQQIMKKNNNIQNNIQSENMVNGSQHIQLGGTATYNNSNTFFFAPDNNRKLLQETKGNKNHLNNAKTATNILQG